jgi:purine-binding chemotaxis protein CheW
MTQFAVFKVGDEVFGIEIEKVVEILKSQKTYTLPELPAFLSGVITVRGEVLPLIDLRRRFGIASTFKKERVIIVRSDNEKIGLVVDEVQEITSLDSKDITNPPSLFKGLKKKYLTGLGKKGDTIIIILNLDDLLTSEEKIILKESEGIFNGDTGS